MKDYHRAAGGVHLALQNPCVPEFVQQVIHTVTAVVTHPVPTSLHHCFHACNGPVFTIPGCGSFPCACTLHVVMTAQLHGGSGWSRQQNVQRRLEHKLHA